MSTPMISRRSFLKAAVNTTLGLSVGSASGFTYANRIEPAWLEVTSVPLKLPRLSPAFHGYRIAQISDIHADDWMTGERLRRSIALVNQQQPDLIAITGDFVTYHPRRVADDLIPALRTLAPHTATVAVPGNHDHWTDIQGVREIMRASGILDLSNRVYTLQRGDALLHIAGVDDIWEEQHDLPAVLNRLPAEGAAILLAHEPDFADVSAASGRFDLQLSGHSHGGQLGIPFGQPPVLPFLGQKYPVGLYQVGTMLQYTNRGLGSSPIRMRFNCRPEITIFTLEAAELSAGQSASHAS